MKRAFLPLIAVCAALGLTLRLWNIDFDQRQHLHPDERFWALTSDALERAPAPAAHGTIIGPVLDWLDGQRSAADPYRATPSFLYGPISLAVARGVGGWLHDGVSDGAQPAHAVASTLDWFGIPLIDGSGAPRFDDGYGVDLVGRMLGAVFDAATIVVIGLIGRRLAGRMAGVIAAGLYAICVLAIQLAHFLGAEPLLGLGCALTVLATLRLDRGASVRRAVLTGAGVGCAAGLAIAAKLTAVGLVAVPFVGCLALLVQHRRRSDVVRLLAMAAATALTFRVLDPGAFTGLGWRLSKPFRDDLRLANELSTSTTPPSFQWADRTPVLQPLVWLGGFTVGPGIVLATVFGALLMGMGLFRRQLAQRLGRCEAELQLLPDVGRWPVLAVGGAAVLPFVYVVGTALPTGRYFIPMMPAVAAIAGAGLATGIRTALQHHGRVRMAASGFVAISVVLALAWGLGFVNGVYGSTNTRVEASRWIASHVHTGSVISSEAWDDGLPLNLPRIDTGSLRGEQLNLVGPDDEVKVARLADQLGRIDYVVESSLRISATVTRMPARFPSTIAFFEGLDSGVLGFTRVATFTTGISIGPWHLDESGAEEAFSVFDHPEVRIWAKTSAVSRDRLIAILDPVAAANAVPVDPNRASANGLLLKPDEVVANADGSTYDQAFDTTGSTSGHAIAWFLLLELFGFAAFVLFLPLLERLPDAGLGLSKVLALATLAFTVFVAAAWLHVDLDRALVVWITVVFLTAAAALGWRRRDRLLALWRQRRTTLVTVEVLTAAMFVLFVLLRSLNPDLWHEYRGGEKPFELALLTAVLRTKTLPVYDPWFSGGALNYYYGGWLLLSGPARLLRTSPALVMNLAMGVFASVSSGAAFSLGGGMVSAARLHRPALRRLRRPAITAGLLGAALVLLLCNGAILRATWRHVERVGPASTVDWWGLSRVIPRSVAVTEFPAWSLLFGDVHPHVMGIAVLLLTATLCLVCHAALVAGRRRHACALAAMLGVVVGLVRLVNTWDYPLAVALIAVTFVAALARRVPWQRCAFPAVVAAATLLLAWMPYTARGEVYDASFDPATLRTPLSSWLEQFGFFVVVSVVMICAAVVPSFGRSPRVMRAVSTAQLTLAGVALVTIGYVAIRPGRLAFVGCVLLAVGCGLVAQRSWRAASSTSRSVCGPVGPFALAIGWALQACVEMLTLRNDGGRANTVFKFWYESWIVLALGAAVALAEQLHRRRRWLRRVSAGIIAVGALGSAAFWWLATPVRVADRVSAGGISLEGEAYLTDKFTVDANAHRFVPADDVPLADWLRAEVHGIQVIAEAPGDDYRWTSRMSWLTGLPSPIGWGYHETQQRRPYGAVIGARQADMKALYTTTDTGEMARVLSTYSVAYLVFGTQERRLASEASAAALHSFVCLTVMVHEAPAVATGGLQSGSARDLYYVARVDRSCVNRLRPPLPPSTEP